MKFITTSWDDGYPADIRLSELLDKYNLRGTFYIPRTNEEHRVMNEAEIASMSRNFEIGGHTLHHKSLKSATPAEVDAEVYGCFDWLKQLTGRDPVSFCLPFGQYSPACLPAIYEAGFRMIRTTELLSPHLDQGLQHTTLQMYDHSGFTYFKHLVKHRRFANLRLWTQSGFSGNIFRLLDHYLDFIGQHGGCLHLWGHSWEIEENGHWAKLEQVFRRISGHPGFSYIENKDLVNACA